jgi:hypothetical protein
VHRKPRVPAVKADARSTRGFAAATGQGSPEGPPGARPKAGYTPPVMRTYGSVTALTMGGAGSFADMAGLNMMMASDRELKERIVRVGTHPLGIGLYLFHFRPEYRETYGSGRQFGVMADEVETVMQQAVCRNAAGFRMVNYAMLGVRRRAS